MIVVVLPVEQETNKVLNFKIKNKNIYTYNNNTSNGFNLQSICKGEVHCKRIWNVARGEGMIGTTP